MIRCPFYQGFKACSEVICTETFPFNGLNETNVDCDKTDFEHPHLCVYNEIFCTLLSNLEDFAASLDNSSRPAISQTFIFNSSDIM